MIGSIKHFFARKKPALLLVDDNLDWIHCAREFIIREGIDCVGESEPEAALLRLGREHFDAALVDYVMPRIGGVEFIRQAKIIKPTMKFAIITAHENIEVPTEIPIINKCGNAAGLLAALTSVLADGKDYGKTWRHMDRMPGAAIRQHSTAGA